MASARSLGQKAEGDKSAREAMQEWEAAEQARLEAEAAEKAAQAVQEIIEESKE